jgi:uncharacterized protein involved in type VI secretion and phage assembly
MADNRFYGLYRGVVTNNKDPRDQMRIKVRVPAILGELETAWAIPCVGIGVGAVLMPEIGTDVWIEFEAGDISRPVWMGTLGIAQSNRVRKK